MHRSCHCAVAYQQDIVRRIPPLSVTSEAYSLIVSFTMAGGDIDFRSDSDAFMIDNDHITIITDAFES